MHIIHLIDFNSRVRVPRNIKFSVKYVEDVHFYLAGKKKLLAR